jgi:hypothetical protein
MPDEEETRLLAALKDCDWLSRVASDALKRPMYTVVVGSAAHRKLVEADATASVKYDAATVALRAYRQAEKQRVSGSGG